MNKLPHSVLIFSNLLLFTASYNVIADTLYYGGNILTMEGENPSYVETLLEQNGKITHLGAMPKKLNKEVKKVNLDGKTLMPGFIDSHGHVTQLALALSIANLAAEPYGNGDSFDAIKTTLKQYINDKNITEGEWVLGMGYDTSILPSHPTKELLDQVSTEHPILIIHSSGHIGVANSKALEIAGITKESKDPAGGIIQKDKQGHLTGVLEESAMWPVLLNVPKSTEEQELKNLTNALNSYASYGVTTVQDGRTTQTDLELLVSAADKNQLYLDVISYPAIEYINEQWQPDFTKYSQYQNRLKIG